MIRYLKQIETRLRSIEKILFMYIALARLTDFIRLLKVNADLDMFVPIS
jgi:hypothetical protein